MPWQLAQRWRSPHGAVAWDRFGQGDPVVLLHGTPFSSFVWRRLVRVLSRRYAVHCLDLLGYGESAKAERVSLDIQSEVFAGWLDHLDLAPAVVAQDFGGTTALRAHLLHGREYSRLLLLDPVVLRPWGTAFVLHVHAYEAAFRALPEYAHRGLLQGYVSTACVKPLDDAELEGILRPWQGSEGQAAFYRQIAQIDERYTAEIEPLLSAIRCPTYLLWGRDDQWLPLKQGEELARLVSAQAFEVVEDAAHLVQYDAPESVTAFLDQHLA